jgi:UPF0755 protein
MEKDHQIDEILRDIEEKKTADDIVAENIGSDPAVDVLAEDARKKRKEQIEGFSLDLDVDSIVADVPPLADDGESRVTAADSAPKEESTPTPTEEPVHPVCRKPRKRNKRLSRILYALFVVLISVLIASVGLLYFFEASGLNGTSTMIDVEIPQGAYTQQIADILQEKGLINNTLFFRIYTKLTKADSLWQVGTFMLSSDMGYAGIVEELQTSTPRENVNITIPEGYTVEEIAHLLHEKGVCEEEDFYNAVVNGEFDYDFVKAIPSAADGEEHAGRIYRLEGYLFPDTYNFYVGSTGEMVVDRMLSNFDSKLTPAIRQQIAEKGWTIDQAIIFASVIQGEAGLPNDMVAVSRVLMNRMQPNSGFPKLQCDSTRDYINAILPSISGVQVTTSPYDTYIREGLPVGAINNPGMMAIQAALNPSNDEEYANCYYFATDYDTGITYYSKTYSQHVAICRKYKIGMYG